jgi:hypothetical protein
VAAAKKPATKPRAIQQVMTINMIYFLCSEGQKKADASES